MWDTCDTMQSVLFGQDRGKPVRLKVEMSDPDGVTSLGQGPTHGISQEPVDTNREGHGQGQQKDDAAPLTSPTTA